MVISFGRRAALAAGAASFLLCTPAAAQLSSLSRPGAGAQPVSGNQPVTFQADSVSYDRVNALVSAEGHVQAWQNDHFLAADRVTFDRNSGVAAAYGHVILLEPDGQVVFADYAEVSGGMKNGVIKGMRALLADGGKLAANGGRRSEGKLNELARAVYSSCDLCTLDPTRPPAWQIRANHLTQDVEHKRIEYSDAWLDILGQPILWLPYMSNTDPSVRRQSGLLPPTFGVTDSRLGSFLGVPYYIVLDDQSDVTVTPFLSTKKGGQIQALYRQRFNDGELSADGALAIDEHRPQGFVNIHSLFNWDDTWRYGANINVGTSINYLRDYRIAGYGSNFLPTNGFIEGFGVGSYARLDASGYQALNSSVRQDFLPYVLPRYQYSFLSEPDFLGGRTSIDTQAFNILRNEGTNSARVAARAEWNRPFAGLFGDRWLLTLQASGTYYHATVLNDEPNYGTVSNADEGIGQIQAALRLNWPFVRSAGAWGTQLIEPIAQVIAAPQSGNSRAGRVPNEDSLDYEFTDATLFSLNRFGGYDRYDGGVRGNFGLHGNWTFPGGQSLDALAGASLYTKVDKNLYPQFQPWGGLPLDSHLSDIVGRVRYQPSTWLDFTARARVDHRNGNVHFGEAVAGFGKPILRLTAGYFYGATNPYNLYVSNFFSSNFLFLPASQTIDPRSPFLTPRQELMGSVSTHVGHWTLAANARRNTQTGKLNFVGASAKYEDECTIFDILFGRRYTSINFDRGDSTLLFTITFKTVGQIGFKG